MKKAEQKTEVKANKVKASAGKTAKSKKRGRKPLVVKLAELESEQLPENLMYLDDIVSQYGFAPVVLDARLTKISRLWDGTKTICLLCVKGESTFMMDSTRCKIKENDVLLVDSGFLFQCNSTTASQLAGMFDILSEKVKHPRSANFFNQEIFNSYIVTELARTFCYELFNQYSKHIPLRRNSEKPGTREMIILRFLSLLDQKVDSERLLGFYAENLGITPQYLTTILKALTGYSANQWIHIVACDKAKHLMLGQRKNILLVAQELNYPDQPSFSKMFKTQTGFTPIQYQNTVK